MTYFHPSRVNLFLSLVIVLIASVARLSQAQGVIQSADYTRAQSLEATGKLDDAVTLYEELYRRTPNDLLFWKLITIHEERGDFKALEQFARSRVSNPEYRTESLRYVARALYGQGKEDEGRATLLGIIGSNWRDQALVQTTAQEFRSRNDLDSAVAVYLKARETTGSAVLYAIELSTIYALQDEYTSALTEILRLIDTTETATTLAERIITSARESGEPIAELESPFRRHLAASPSSLPAARLLAGLLVDEGKRADAYAILRGPAEKAGAAPVLEAFAARMEREGDRRLALTVYGDCYRLFPKAPGRTDFLLKAAALQRDTGDLAGAREAWGRIISDAPGTLSAARASLQLVLASGSAETDTLLASFIESTDQREAAFEAALALGDHRLRAGAPEKAQYAYSQAKKASRTPAERSLAAEKAAWACLFEGDMESLAAEIGEGIAARPESSGMNDLLACRLLGLTCATPADAAAFTAYRKGYFARYRGNMDEAVTAFSAAADSGTVVASPASCELADIHREAGRFTEAARLYRRAAALAGADTAAVVGALLDLGSMTASGLGDVTAARTLYVDILTRYPGTVYDAEVRRRLGEVARQ